MKSPGTSIDQHYSMGRVLSLLIVAVTWLFSTTAHADFTAPTCSQSGYSPQYSAEGVTSFSPSDVLTGLDSYYRNSNPSRLQDTGHVGDGGFLAYQWNDGSWENVDNVYITCKPYTPPPQQCKAGHVVYVNVAINTQPPTLCSVDDRCQMTPNGAPFMSIPGNTPDQWNGTYTYTGATCDDGTQQSATANNLNADDNGCRNFDGGGRTGLINVCANQSEPIVDGVPHDYAAAPDNTCTTGPDGGVVCYTDTSHASGTPIEQATPPAPDQGTGKPNTPADPQNCVTVYGSGGVTITCQFSPSTADNSTNYGNQPPCSGGATLDPTTHQCSSGSSTRSTTGTTTGTTTGSTTGASGGDSISGGQDCKAPPSCDGDPIQCYQAQVQWDTVCAYRPDDQAVKHFDDAVTGGAPLTAGAAVPQLSDADYSEFNNYFAGNVGAAACLADTHLNFTIGDHAFDVAIPLSQMCPVLQIVRLIVLVTFALASARVFAAGLA